MAVVAGGIILAVTGYVEEGAAGELPLTMVALLQVPLWVGYLGVPWLVARRKGNGLVADFGLRSTGWDIPKGLGAGLATQLLAIPVLYYVIIFPLLDALGVDTDRDLSAAARELTDKAEDPVGVVLLVLIVVVGAPIIEEIFFRGLLLRAVERRWNPAAGLWVSSILFGAVHLQLLQLPALVLFGLVAGWLTQRHDRLGPAIWAHVAFNGTATALLLAG